MPFVKLRERQSAIFPRRGSRICPRNGLSGGGSGPFFAEFVLLFAARFRKMEHRTEANSNGVCPDTGNGAVQERHVNSERSLGPGSGDQIAEERAFKREPSPRRRLLVQNFLLWRQPSRLTKQYGLAGRTWFRCICSIRRTSGGLSWGYRQGPGARSIVLCSGCTRFRTDQPRPRRTSQE